MSVDHLLNKIQSHNPNVRGCVLSTPDKVFSNLSGNYEVVDTTELTELADRLLNLSEAAPELEPGSDTAFLEFEHHSMFVRRIEDDSCLVLLTDPMSVAGFKKISVGINLFLKPLKVAMTEPCATDKASQPATPRPAPPVPPATEPMILRAGDPIERKRTAINPEPEVPSADPQAPSAPPRRWRFSRGAAQ
ncbi:MAG: hypothetical protein AAGE38_03385 [Pseudomonadota bacterium]